MTQRACSLWLMPTGTVYQELSQLISRLAKENSSIEFQPHITLIGNVEAQEEKMIMKTREVASLLRPCPVKLVDIGYTDYYYRALYLNVNPSPEVLIAYQVARKIFFGDSDTSYMPHLSLLYGDFSIEVKKQITSKIGNNFTNEFEANTLYLYLTEGIANDWQEIGAFPLQNVGS